LTATDPFSPEEMEQALGQRLVREISPNDEMHDAGSQYYFEVGYSALKFVTLSLLAAERPAPRRILDLPCGHGRALRMLSAAFPDAEITAADLNRDGVDFCASRLGAKPIYSHPLPDQIKLSGSFDLIFCGSLLTHLDAGHWIGFLNLFQSLLEPGGIVVFTTHGQLSIDLMLSGVQTYGMKPDSIARIVKSHKRHGFGYHSYSGSSDYGISVSSTPWVLREAAKLPGWHLAAYFPQAWAKHQDVYAYVRAIS
ncbi:MAG: class I SAM-dependent methyltransferase, partial [Acidobacteriota bacterium]|nr:class I SAM-dependent methyltransferase [Acidobacteriota bacterium]